MDDPKQRYPSELSEERHEDQDWRRKNNTWNRRGKVTGKIKTSKGEEQVEIPGVLHVPELDRSLASTRVIIQAGGEVRLKKEYGEVKIQEK